MLDTYNELQTMEAKKKIYIYSIIENCVIYILVFIGLCVFKTNWILLLLLFCNAIKRKGDKK